MGPKSRTSQGGRGRRGRVSPSTPADMPLEVITTPEETGEGAAGETSPIDELLNEMLQDSETSPGHSLSAGSPRDESPSQKYGTSKGMLTPSQETQVAEWLSVHPEYYDKTDSQYLCKERNQAVMKKFAEDIGVSCAVLQTWLKSQRTQLGKDIKDRKYPTSGSARKDQTGRAAWRAKNLAFLTPHIQVRTASKQLGQGVSYNLSFQY